MPDGSHRHSVWFSITREDWPTEPVNANQPRSTRHRNVCQLLLLNRSRPATTSPSPDSSATVRFNCPQAA